MEDLKQKAVRGGVARLCAQCVTFLLRIAALMILARLLTPQDFGLVNMVTVVTSVLFLLRDFGLSAASVQHPAVTQEQISGLFWINVAVGSVIWLSAAAVAPAIASFYNEPRLYHVTIALSAGFLFNALGVQHSALLQRQIRFTTLAVINVISSALSIIIGISAAVVGYGYWALVVMAVTGPFSASLGFWVTARWLPSKPCIGAGIGSLIKYGCSLTFTSVLVYIGYNAEKVMIGRLWGADAIGIYGRAYQIISIPTENLNSSIGEVVFSTLSRLQHDQARFRSYFLKSFSLILGLTLPVTFACGLFADDLVYILLGSTWRDAAAIVRLLAPTITVFAIINPLGWVVFSLGLVTRGLKVAPLIAAIMVTGYIISVPYGLKAVALVYSASLVFWVIPHIFLCLHRTPISVWDIAKIISRLLGCGIAAAGVGFSVHLLLGAAASAVIRLLSESLALFVTFFTLLLFVGEQRALYMEVVSGLRGSISTKKQQAIA